MSFRFKLFSQRNSSMSMFSTLKLAFDPPLLLFVVVVVAVDEDEDEDDELLFDKVVVDVVVAEVDVPPEISLSLCNPDGPVALYN